MAMAAGVNQLAFAHPATPLNRLQFQINTRHQIMPTDSALRIKVI